MNKDPHKKQLQQSTDEETLFDQHEDMETVDYIPNEELNDKVKDEKNKDETKSTSSSERL